jgi:hypothetical protein
MLTMQTSVFTIILMGSSGDIVLVYQWYTYIWNKQSHF